ncbi:MAG: acyl-CoA dehydrogenase C-terminal domain-containing protein, partial [Pseudomonadota bacterium]
GLIMDEIEAAAEAARASMPDLAEPVWQACESLRETTEWMIAQNHRVRFAGAVPYLRAFARVLGGYIHLQSAVHDTGGAHEKVARFYIQRLLPEHGSLLAQAQAGDYDVYALTPEEFAA